MHVSRFMHLLTFFVAVNLKMLRCELACLFRRTLLNDANQEYMFLLS